MAGTSLHGALEQFVKGQDSAEISERLGSCVRRAQLVFATADIKEEPEKKSLIQIWGGDLLMMLFEHVGKVQEKDTFDVTIKKAKEGLKATMNEVFLMYKLFNEMPKANKRFTDWHPEILEQARRCPLENYTPERAVRGAITMQTSSSRLRKKLIKLGCTSESTDKQVADMSHTENVRLIKKDQFKLTQKIICDSFGYDKEKAHRNGGLSSKRQAMCGLQKGMPFRPIDFM